MDTLEFDDHSGRRSPDEPGVRFVRGGAEVVRLWYGTFDLLLRTLHDLWWRDRRIGRLRLLTDWIGDRGVFDPEGARSVIDDLPETSMALAIVRDRLARRADPGEEVDAAIAVLIGVLDAAIAENQSVWVERI